MNLVLYRKYRPQSFAEIIGQDVIKKTLTNAISNSLISHAYLFYGQRGSGKTTIARLFAKAINCENRKDKEFEPCNKCSSCLEIAEGKSMDLIEIDAASNRGIDEIRELKEAIKFHPVKSKYKVYIIDESHQITKDAANALLKTLEEPPSYVVFILATTELHKMIPTIVSRCQKFDFKKLTFEEIIKRLEFIAKKEKISIEKEVLKLIAQNAGGSFRDAESLFNQILIFAEDKIQTKDIKDLLGLIELSVVMDFCDLLAAKNAKESIIFLNKITDNGLDLQEFSKSLISYLRQVMVVKLIGEKDESENNFTKEEFERLKKQSLLFTESDLKLAINQFLEAENKMKYSPIIQLPLELAVLEIAPPKE